MSTTTVSPGSFRYSAYGLRIDSQFPLFVRSGVDADPGTKADTVTIRSGSLDRIEPERPGGTLRYRASGDEVRLCQPGLARYRIRSGDRIVVDPEPRADGRRLGRTIWRYGLSLALQQRGLLVLHGSSVRVGDLAAVFLGESGAGKSTLAAAMHLRGHELLADEITVLAAQSGVWRLQPGPLEVELLPQATWALGLRVGALEPSASKVTVSLETQSLRSPTRLGKIYVLEKERGLEARDLPAQDAFLQLLLHTYCAPLLSDMGLAGQHLEGCADLVESTPIASLRLPRDPRQLAAARRLVERDLDRTGASSWN